MVFYGWMDEFVFSGIGSNQPKIQPIAIYESLIYQSFHWSRLKTKASCIFRLILQIRYKVLRQVVNSQKEILFISIIGIMMCSGSPYKTGITRLRYFDENNIEISKSKFNQIRSTNLLLDIQGDSAHHKRLILREEHEKITNRPFLETL